MHIQEIDQFSIITLAFLQEVSNLFGRKIFVYNVGGIRFGFESRHVSVAQ